MFPNLIQIGPVTLHTYGLLIAVAVFLAYHVARRGAVERRIPAEKLDRLVMYVILAGFVGARLLYFGVDGFAGLRRDPLAFFRIWEGGLVFYGSVIGGFLALLVFARVNELRALTLTDLLAPALLLGHTVGRLGCFAAGCCYGRPTDSFLGVVFTHPESLAPKHIPLHPTQLYASAGTFALFLVAFQWSKRAPKTGALTAFYLVGYGVFRFVLEFFRGDDRGMFIAGLAPSQWIAMFMAAAGVAVALRVASSRGK